MRNKQQKEAEPQAQPSHPSREEGLYYEKVFAPQKVEVFWNDKTKALTKLMFKDKNGQALEVAERRLVSRVLMYFAPYTDFGKISELRALEPNLLQKALNLAIKKRGKDLKALYDDKGCLEGVASTLHEQISWKKVKEIVESAIRKVTGGQVITPEDTDHAFKWNYRVPVKDNNVSSWVGVNAGNNIIKGRSGIRIFSRFRTEKEDSKGGVKRPACLNWCGMWQFPQQFFNINVSRLDNIVKYIGKENVKDIEMAQFHLKPDLKAFRNELETGLENMVKAMKKITPVIDKSIHSPLKKGEMEDILSAYQSRGNSYLPDYIVEQIMNHVEEETVWGFSQAVSWVRTHGEFKCADSSSNKFKPVEDRDLTLRLENIAGEVLSLTPTINDIHKKHGRITLVFLVGKEKAKEIREAQEKARMEVPAEVLTSRAQQAWATRRKLHPERYGINAQVSNL